MSLHHFAPVQFSSLELMQKSYTFDPSFYFKFLITKETRWLRSFQLKYCNLRGLRISNSLIHFKCTYSYKESGVIRRIANQKHDDKQTQRSREEGKKLSLPTAHHAGGRWRTPKHMISSSLVTIWSMHIRDLYSCSSRKLTRKLIFLYS